MNRYQKAALLASLLNLLLVLAFPPYDYLTRVMNGTAPVFDGFSFVFLNHPNRVLDQQFWQLEIFVVLAEAALAWLLLRSKAGRSMNFRLGQRIVLLLTALNLLLVILFPPMQRRMENSLALLPSFDGFFFVFGDHAGRTIEGNLIYLEIVFVLFGGGLLYLLLRREQPLELTESQRRELFDQLQKQKK